MQYWMTKVCVTEILDMFDLLHFLHLLGVLPSSPWKFWNSFSRYTLKRKRLVPGLHSVWIRCGNGVILQFDSRWTELNRWNCRIWKQWAYIEQAESWCQHFLWSHTLISQNKHRWNKMQNFIIMLMTVVTLGQNVGESGSLSLNQVWLGWNHQTGWLDLCGMDILSHCEVSAFFFSQ